MMFGSSPLSPSFSIVPPVWSVVVSYDGVGKGGSQVLVPNLVVIAKVDASGLRVLFFLIVHEVRKLILKLAFDDPLRTTFTLFVSLTVPPWRDVVVQIKFQQVLLPLKLRRCSWTVMGHPISRLGTRHIPLFDSNLHLQDQLLETEKYPGAFDGVRWSLLFYSMMRDLSDQFLETDPGAFDGFVGPLLESKDLISKERGVACWKEVIKGS
ncbi:hypothetical protein Tco_1504713 [Tanacetum coccineum]